MQNVKNLAIRYSRRILHPMKEITVLHPLLFALFFVLALYAHNIGELSPSVLVVPLLITAGSTVVLFLLAFLVLRDVNKGGIIVSMFAILFFSYGHAVGVIESWGIGNVQLDGHLIGTPLRYIAVVWVMLFAGGSFFVVRMRRTLSGATVILNVVGAVMVIIPTINIALNEIHDSSKDTDVVDVMALDGIELRPQNPETLPDIYYIILDSHASSSTLDEIYDYDNSDFTDWLAEKGFRVAPKSHSNYAHTDLSLSSSLNMDYIDALVSEENEESLRESTWTLIQENRVVRFLKSNGYKFVLLASGWGRTSSSPYADLELRCGRFNEFEVELIATTMLLPFDPVINGKDTRGRILRTFSTLGEVPGMKEPTFAFAHILCPHEPYVFGPNGEKVEAGQSSMDEKTLYLNQLRFVDKMVRTLVDEILSKSEVPPIIILQSDHGPCSTLGDHWGQPTDENIRERTTILNAYYLGEKGNDLLYDSITPVNTFRLILNLYFGGDCELLEDRVYFSSDDHRFGYYDITDRIPKGSALVPNAEEPDHKEAVETTEEECASRSPIPVCSSAPQWGHFQ